MSFMSMNTTPKIIPLHCNLNIELSQAGCVPHPVGRLPQGHWRPQGEDAWQPVSCNFNSRFNICCMRDVGTDRNEMRTAAMAQVTRDVLMQSSESEKE